tara:strand:+ start:157 stop:288 length:132 start_codon:yes stop_codon:yes gene_type:complete
MWRADVVCRWGKYCGKPLGNGLNHRHGALLRVLMLRCGGFVVE